jgi:hypothetical protein
MSVTRKELAGHPAQIPYHVQILLDETADDLSDWQSDREVNSFVPADYVLVFDALVELRPQMTERKPVFLEWGSGMGLVTLLASALGWKASGIEIQPVLIEHSRALSRNFDLPATFHSGSFFPGDTNTVEKLSEYCRQADVIYVYPWPDQELEIFDLFDRLAKPGAYLLTYYGIEDVRLFQKD